MSDQYDELEKLVAEGMFAVAEPKVLDWLQYHPNDARAWLLYGKCVRSPNQKKDCFKRAVELDPLNSEARELLEQFNVAASQRPQVNGQLGGSVSSSFTLSPTPPKFSPSGAISRAPVLSEQSKNKLSIVLYSFFHFLFTLLFGAALVYIFSLVVPGLLSFNQSDDAIQRNWLSNVTPSDADQELKNLADVFLNPSQLDYRTVSTYQELNNFRVAIKPDPSAPASIDFIGVSFVGQLVGGNVLQSGTDERPLVVVMNVALGETRIPVVYYGPATKFNYDDMILVEGVYVEEAGGIIAQRIERLSPNESDQVDNETLFMLRMAGAVLLWALFCFSVFFWRLNLKRWSQAQASPLSPISVVLLLIPIMILISGCTIDLSTTLRPDGTGITSVLVSESRENMDFLRSAPGVPGYLSAIVKEMRISGAMFEQYIEGDQEVFLIQRYFNNSGAGTENTYPTQGSWSYVQRYREGNEEVIRFLCVVDTRTLFDNPDRIESNAANVLRDQLNQMDMKYHLNVPGSLVFHNGDEATSQQVSWRIQMNDVNYLVAESRFPAEDKTVLSLYTSYIWIGTGIVFLISTLFLISSIWVRPATS